MKKMRVYFLSFTGVILTICFIFILSFIITFVVKSNVPHSKLDKIIVIDAGHGGIDAGANRGEVLEKDINLAIAKKLANFLDKGNIKVIMTRTEDKLYQNDRNKDIVNRVKIVEENNADLLISIHVNSFPSSQSFGGQTFYSPNSKEGKKLASAIQEKLIEIQPKNYRQIKSAPYYILRKTEIPAVIVEVGFISNPEDKKRITNSKEQTKIAQGIAKGVINYFNSNLHLLPTEKTTLATNHSTRDFVNLYYGINQNGKEGLEGELISIKSFTNESSDIEEIATKIILKLLQKPQNQKYLRLIPKDTRLINLTIKDSTAYVNFNQRFIGKNNGGGKEWLQIQSIIKTLTQLEEIKHVRLLVEDKPLRTDHFYFNYDLR